MSPWPSTSWTLLEQASEGDESAYLEFVERYRRPILAFFTRDGSKLAEAEELRDSFFEEKILQGRLLEKADRNKGSKFRSYLCTALHNHKWSYFRKGEAKKRKHTPVPIDDGETHISEKLVADAASPEQAFDREYVRTLIDETISEASRHCEKKGMTVHWSLFQGFYLEQKGSWESLGAPYRLNDKIARERARTVLGVCQRIIRRKLSEEVGPDRVDDEILTLIAIMGD